MTDTKREAPASPEKRAAALEIVLRRKADMPKNFVAEFTEHADDAWITANGAQSDFVHSSCGRPVDRNGSAATRDIHDVGALR